MSARRPLGPALAAVLLLSAVSGCASIPDSGPVRSGRDTSFPVADSPVRVIPPPPRDGATPDDLVRGFLLASASATDDRVAARDYLTPAASARWRPGAGARIYDSESLQVLTTGLTVSVSATQVSSLTADNRYVPLLTPRTLTTKLTLDKVDGQWRIAELEDGLLHTTFDLRRTYTPASVYYLDPARRTVVPDLLVLPAQARLATALTTRLLAGPSAWLAAAVRTVAPPGTALAVPSVPVVDGVAQVDLTEPALSAGPEQRQALSAQLVWTLRQLPDVRAVRITVEGGAFPVPGISGEQSRDSWPSYDPALLPGPVEPAVVRDGRLGRLDNSVWTPLPGAAGAGDVAIAAPALSAAADVLAALTPGRTRLLRGPVAPGGELRPVLVGADLARPSWDPYGTVWVTDRRDGTVRAVTGDGEVVPVAVDAGDGARVVAVQIARDGTRAALAVRRGGRDELMVAAVEREGSRPERLSGATLVDPDVVQVTDLVWVDAARLAVAGAVSGAEAGVRTVDVTGWAAVDSAAIEATSVAAAPGRPLLASSGQEVYRAAGRSWTLVGPGEWPVYPG